MSDDGADYYEDYDFPEELYGTAVSYTPPPTRLTRPSPVLTFSKDDLAEHALPSPVWVSYDPDFDIESPFSDCEEYFSDEYYDEGIGSFRKRKEDNAVGGETVTKKEPMKKKRKFGVTRKTPELKLPGKRRLPLRPTVFWKSREELLRSSSPRELVIDGEGEKVAILKDWREKFKLSPASTPVSHESRFEMNDGDDDEHCDEDGLRNLQIDSLEDADTTRLPPFSLTDDGVSHPQADDSEPEAFINVVYSMANILPPEYELPPSSNHKRKAAELDAEGDSRSHREKPTSSKLSITELAESTEGRSNGHFDQHSEKRNSRHDTSDDDHEEKDKGCDGILDGDAEPWRTRRSRRRTRT